MPHWIGTPQVDVQIRYHHAETASSNNASPPTYTGDDRVSGSAVFLLKKNYENLRYKVVVKGNVQTKIVENCRGTLSSNSTYDTHTFFSTVFFDGRRTATAAGSKYQAEVPFSFTLQNPNGQSSLDLLPSTDSKHSKGHWSDNFKTDATVEYQITYTVIASAIQDKKVIASTPSRFHYLPATPSPEPVLPEDYPGEYLVRTSKVQQIGGTTTRLGVISQEPAALSLRASDSTLTTNVNIVLMLVRQLEGNHKPTPFPRKYDITAQLKATTFVMPQRSRPELHTIHAAPHSKAVIKQSRTNTQRHTAAFHPWESHDSESEDDRGSHSEEVLTNTISIPFTINVDQALTPDFWSSLLSRRHTLELALTLDDDTGTTTKLRLPVQIYQQPKVEA